MPPRRAKRQAGAAGAATPPSPLLSLPGDVLQLVWGHLVQFDKMNFVETACRDIASLAQTCSVLNAAAKDSLWGLLGEQMGFEEPARGDGLRVVPKDERYDALHLPIAMRRLEKAPTPEQVAEDYEEEVPEEVPGHVYSEVRRLRCLGLAGTTSKKVFLLTDSDLRAIPHVEKSRGARGTSHICRLVDVVAAARVKHGSLAGMEAAAAAKADMAERRKQRVADAAEARRQELADALAPLGAQLSATMLKVGVVAAFVKGGKEAPAKERLLPFLQLADWAERHAFYVGTRQEIVTSHARFLHLKINFRDEYERDGRVFGPKADYYDRALRAREELTQREEEDCVRLGCQDWANSQGGLVAALAHPAMPAAGTPLRAAVEAALRQQIETGIPYDAGFDDWFEDEEVYGGVYAEDPSEGAGAPAAAFLAYGYQQFVQVEAAARSPADLAALQVWLRPWLRWLAGRLAPFSGAWLAEACLHPFRLPAPPAVEGSGVDSSTDTSARAGSAPTAVFLIGLEEKQAPSSLYQPVGDAGAGPSRPSPSPASRVESLGAALSDRLGKWEQRQEGMELRLGLLGAGELPAWVAA